MLIIKKINFYFIIHFYQNSYELWYKLDRTYKTPQAGFMMDIRSATPLQSDQNLALLLVHNNIL
jgi:hypothetical protein